MPRISESIEETIAQLDAVHAPIRERKAAAFAKLEAIVSNLDAIPPPLENDEAAFAPEPRRRRPAEPQPAQPGLWPFDEPEIQDGREAHRFTGALGQKLIAEALKKSDW